MRQPVPTFPDTSHGEIWTRYSCPCCRQCFINQFGKCPYGGPFRGYEIAPNQPKGEKS